MYCMGHEVKVHNILVIKVTDFILDTPLEQIHYLHMHTKKSQCLKLFKLVS